MPPKRTGGVRIKAEPRDEDEAGTPAAYHTPKRAKQEAAPSRQDHDDKDSIVSPVFPGWPRPTREECFALDAELSALHGAKVQPPHSGMSVMDSLVATILSQNTTSKNSKAAMAKLKASFPSWDTVCTARTSDIEEAIRSGGLAAIKAKRIQEICTTILAERGKVCLEHLASAPSETIKQELSRFPGCGPKTISCVLLFNLQRPDFAVDTHVFRLASAAGWVPAESDVRAHNARIQAAGKSATEKPARKRKAERGWPPASRETAYLHLNAMVPDTLKYSLHVNLIAHGRTLSPASGPKDPSTCPIARRGQAGAKCNPNTVTQMPKDEAKHAD